MHLLIAMLLIVLDLFLQVFFSLFFFSCDLMTVFSVVLGFFFSCFHVCMYYRFLICGSHEDLIQQSIYTHGCF